MIQNLVLKHYLSNFEAERGKVTTTQIIRMALQGGSRNDVAAGSLNA